MNRQFDRNVQVLHVQVLQVLREASDFQAPEGDLLLQSFFL